MLPDMVIKIVSMKRAKQAAACLSFQPPNILVVCVAVSSCPAHLYQRIAVGKQRLLTLLCPLPFLPHDAHMEVVGVYIYG